jgi:hypothetical protein
VLDAATRLAQLVHERLRCAEIGAPWLLGVVRHPGVQQHGRTVSDDAPRDGRPDRDPTARAGHDHNPILQRPPRHEPMIA